MNPLRLLACTTLLLITAAIAAAQDNDRTGVTAAFEGFYNAMKTGDAVGAMRHIAPDAVFVEGGRLETRQQYETGHLPADIEFERAVAGKRSPLDIKFNGNTAWVIATTEYEGMFEGAPVHFVSAQLMVLSRTGTGPWLIRSVHWSSRRL